MTEYEQGKTEHISQKRLNFALSLLLNFQLLKFGLFKVPEGEDE